MNQEQRIRELRKLIVQARKNARTLKAKTLRGKNTNVDYREWEKLMTQYMEEINQIVHKV